MGFYHHFQTATTFVDLIPSFKYAYTSLKQSYKTPVKKDLMRIILFRTYKHLKLSVILYIFHVLIIFLIYQTVRSLPSKIESLCSEFCKWFQHNKEDKAVSSFYLCIFSLLMCKCSLKQLYTQYFDHQESQQKSLRK